MITLDRPAALPEPIIELTDALKRAGAHDVSVDQPDSDHPELLNVLFSAFSRSDERPTTHGYVECHLTDGEVRSFAVGKTHDSGHRDTVVSQGAGDAEMLGAAVSLVASA